MPCQEMSFPVFFYYSHCRLDFFGGLTYRSMLIAKGGEIKCALLSAILSLRH